MRHLACFALLVCACSSPTTVVGDAGQDADTSTGVDGGALPTELIGTWQISDISRIVTLTLRADGTATSTISTWACTASDRDTATVERTWRVSWTPSTSMPGAGTGTLTLTAGTCSYQPAQMCSNHTMYTCAMVRDETFAATLTPYDALTNLQLIGGAVAESGTYFIQ